MQGLRDRFGDGKPTARQCQDQRIRSAVVMELLGEAQACVSAIPEHPDHLLTRSMVARMQW